MPAQSLDLIKIHVQEELDQFDQLFKNALKSHISLLDKISYYIVKTRGKQFRPLISLLSAKLFGPVTDQSYTSAILVELLHTATLVHDDVVDNSYQRRGFFSINALWKNKIAVLVGDYLLAKGLLTALNNEQFDVLRILSNAVKEMSEGELLQLEKSRSLDIDEQVYFQIIGQKTASLISAACQSGAASTTQNKTHIELMQKFGYALGIAFQIKDDLLDLSEEEIGKPKTLDIKDQKMTLPLIAALSKADPVEKGSIRQKIRNQSDDEQIIKQVIAFIHKYQGIQYAESKLLEYHRSAIDTLYQLPDNQIRHALEQLADFVVHRKK